MTSFADWFLASTNTIISGTLSHSALSGQDRLGRMGLATIAEHLCLSDNAKRARPLLCLYSHWLFDAPVQNNFTKVGVAAEFIHAASLLHDDVVDEASKRRGRASANAVYGNAQAVLAGNFLLTHAFELLRTFPRALADRAITVVRDMTESAFLEINSRGKLELSEDTWQAIAKGKTGVLFSWCSFAAAICANQKKQAERLWKIGQIIGQIFQMADDLKDFSGDSNLKDRCQDIRNREPSLPIILALRSHENIADAFARSYQSSSLSEEQVSYLCELVWSSGAIEATRERMDRALCEVRAELRPFEGSAGKNLLDRWVAGLAEDRSYV